MKFSVLNNLAASVVMASRTIGLDSNKGIVFALKKCFRLVFLRAAPMLYHLGGHLQLTRVLSSPHVSGLAKRHPKLAYKYVGGNYLARCFSTKTRLAILTKHYSYLKGYVVDDFLASIYDAKTTLWQECKDDLTFSIALSFPFSLHHPGRPVDYEGDLSLLFEIDSLPVYVFCFTIIPGEVVDDSAAGAGCDPALFISRIQGEGGHFPLIRKATKLLNEISPKDLLLTATQAIALSLNIRTLVGVSTEDQLSKNEHTGKQDIFFDYNHFWLSLGAERTAGNMFRLAIPLPEKPIELIAQHHRARTLRKRKFKEQLLRHVRNEFQERFLKTS
jgi:uncharacterized protein VirK/YbjX